MDLYHKRAFTFDCSAARDSALCLMTRQTTDAVKIIAAIAVVGIHATSTAESNFFRQHDFFSLDFLGVLVNQMARFSVPLFLYLSAYGLAKSDKKSEDGFLHSYLNFLWKRLPTILVPYFFFSGISLALEFHSYNGALPELAQKIVQKLRTGGADYHLYFLVILAQCYLFFPLLLRIARAFPGGYRIATWLVLALVAGLLYKGSSEFLLPKMGLNHPGWHASFAIYWLPYFMLGILHAHRLPQLWNSIASADPAAPAGKSVLWKFTCGATVFGLSLRERCRTTTALFVAVSAMALVIAEYVYYSRQGDPVDYYNHFSRPSVMLYALAVVYLLHSRPHPPAPSPSIRRGGEVATAPQTSKAISPPSPLSGEGGWGGEVAKLTFSVYLIHPQVLRLLTNYAGGLSGVFMWIITVITTFTIVYGLTLLTNKLAQKSPAAIAGPVQFLQRCFGLR